MHGTFEVLKKVATKKSSSFSRLSPIYEIVFSRTNKGFFNCYLIYWIHVDSHFECTIHSLYLPHWVITSIKPFIQGCPALLLPLLPVRVSHLACRQKNIPINTFCI